MPKPKDEPKTEEPDISAEEEAASDAALDALAKAEPGLFTPPPTKP